MNYLEKYKQIHGNKYKYPDNILPGEYKNKIKCKEHGYFYQTARGHLKYGCKQCGRKSRIEKIKKPIFEIKKLIETIYGNLYNIDYSNYKNTNSILNAKCSKHGEFKTKITNLIRNNRTGICPKCRVNPLTTLTEFIEKCTNLYNGKYTYTKTIFNSIMKKAIVTCKEHGDYYVRVRDHLKGRHGCPRCKKFIIDIPVNERLEKIITKSKYLFGDKFSFDDSVYINCNVKIKIKCNTHNEFFYQKPYEHFKRIGCKKCLSIIKSENKKITTCEFVKRAKEVHGDRYLYDFVNYKDSSTKVTITCRLHGNFNQVPSYHISGNGCPICSESRGERMIKKYLIKNNIYYLKEYKIPDQNNKYRYDFYLPEKNIIIEFHGIQHYMYVPYFHKDKSVFLDKKLRDCIKKDIAQTLGIKYIEIPYTIKKQNKVNETLNFFIS